MASHARMDGRRVLLIWAMLSLALVGSADERDGRSGIVGPSAVVPTDEADRQPSLRGVAGPVQLAIAGGPLPRPSAGSSAGGAAPSTGPGCAVRLPARALALRSPLRGLGTTAADRARLAFAHQAGMARSGALSSFATSLPPPLLG